jgi:hypothetical protein
VPVVPIYIQEKVHPQAIIDDLISTEDTSEEDWMLFSDFNGGPKEFDKKIDFYHHEQNWTNRLILGDSLLVMNSLSEKEGLKGKVQTVYIDPPYGIKFGSNWQVSTRKRDVKDNRADDATRQPEQIRAFRDTWQLGINSYLSYLRDRLTVTRELLTESGSVFVQIGEQNVHLVRGILDEVFGSANFVREIIYQKTSGAGAPGELKVLPSVCDFIIWYAKDIEKIKYRRLYKDKVFGGEGASGYTNVELKDGTRRSMTSEERENIELLPSGSRIFAYDNTVSQGTSEGSDFPLVVEGQTYNLTSGHWKTDEPGMLKLIAAKRLVAAKNIPVVAAGRAVSGRWTALNWSANDLDSLGYTGLYVEAKTANEFVNHVYVDVLPTTMDSAKNITLANQPGNPKYATSLDGDLTISVTVKTGEIKPGVLVGVGTNFTGNYTKSNNQSIITFTGSPVMVPLAAKSADCSGETGIGAVSTGQRLGTTL